VITPAPAGVAPNRAHELGGASVAVERGRGETYLRRASSSAERVSPNCHMATAIMREKNTSVVFIYCAFCIMNRCAQFSSSEHSYLRL